MASNEEARKPDSDYYSVLGVESTATLEQIRSAFREKARILHPDNKETGDKKAFETLAEAYDELAKRHNVRQGLPLFCSGAGVMPLVLVVVLVAVVYVTFGSSIRPAINGALDAVVKSLNQDKAKQ